MSGVWQAWLGEKDSGEPLAIPRGAVVGWELGYGVKPRVARISMTTARVNRLWERARKQFAVGVRTRERGAATGPLTLAITDGERTIKAEGLYLVERGAGADPINTLSMRLADQRWLWGRTFVERSYNMRRKTGDYRIVRDELQPIQLGQLSPDYAYRRSTLLNGKPWTPLEVLEDLLKELCGPGGYEIAPGLASGLQDTIEGLELHDRGDRALARVLAMIPGARVFVDMLCKHLLRWRAATTEQEADCLQRSNEIFPAAK